MSLVKWFRKNNSKIMAVVVIVLMVAFVGGSALMQLLRSGTGLNNKIAYIKDDIAITSYDIYQAGRELEVLRTLGADRILKLLPINYFNTTDLHGFFLSELLFSQSSISTDYLSYVKELVSNNLYEISEKQINDIYRRSLTSEFYWFCLKHEAHSAGIMVRNEEAGQLLGSIIPQLFSDLTYSQVISSIVAAQGITEEQILSAFSSLLSILQYSHLICSNEDITTRQLKLTTAANEQSVDVEFVEFRANDFSEQQEEPAEEQIIEQFDEFKNFFPGFITSENPYGFGYKQTEKVQLEYIAVRLSDVAQITPKPTQDQMEEYYSNNKNELFSEQVLSDPNDPNSTMINKPRLYSEVASTISRELSEININNKAESIIQEAITLADAPFREMDSTDLVQMSSEELAQISEDYEQIAGDLSEKYGIKIASGKTGLLIADKFLSEDETLSSEDDYLARLYFESSTGISVPLVKVAFAVEGLGITDLGPYEMSVPRLYENIGLAKDVFSDIYGKDGKIVALLRVVQTVEASVPQSVDTIYDTSGIVFDSNEIEEGENTYSIREVVVEDLKNLFAMETAENKCEEFFEMVQEDSWEDSVDKFNELYGQQDPNDPNSTEIQSAQEILQINDLTGLKRISQATMNAIDLQSSTSPISRALESYRQKNNLIMEKFFSLIPADSNDVDIFPLIMEFKPDMSYLCIKDLNINYFWNEDYEDSKAIQLYTLEHIRSQSLSVVHFNPDNILKRMSFEVIGQQTDEDESVTQTEDAS